MFGLLERVTLNWTVAEKALMFPMLLIAATDTVYSALGTKSCSVTLVLDEYTVVLAPVPLLSWYLTL